MGSWPSPREGQEFTTLKNELRERFGQCDLFAPDMAGFEDVLDMQYVSTEVVILEVPVPAIYLTALEDAGETPETQLRAWNECLLDPLDARAQAAGTILMSHRRHGHRAARPMGGLFTHECRRRSRFQRLAGPRSC